MKKYILLGFLFLLSKSAFLQVNLNQGLVAYFPFNGNTNDLSGNGNNATNIGASLTIDQWGNANSAFKFDGVTNYMEILNNSTIQLTNAYTLCARVYPTGFYQGVCFANSIIDKGWPDFNSGNYNLRFLVTDNPSNSCYNLDTTKENFTTQYQYYCNATTMNTTPYVQKNNWYCVIGIFDGNDIKMYVNGVLRYQCNIPGQIGTNSKNLLIGRHGNPTYPYWFKGSLDEIRVYNRALNQQEIDSICNFTPTIVNQVNGNFTKSHPLICDSTFLQFNDSSISLSPLNYWLWDFGDPSSGGNNISSLQNPTHQFSGPGNYTVTLIVGNTQGAFDTVINNITVSASIHFANAGNDAFVCPGETIQLQASGGVSYNWQPLSSVSNPNISNPIASPNSTTIYTVTVTNINGCIDTDEIKITVLNNIPIVILPDSSLCLGEILTLTASGGSDYIWSPSFGLNTTSGSTVNCNTSSTTTYTISYTDINGCPSKQTHTVLVYPYPLLNVSKSNDIECSKKSALLNVTGANNYSWTPSEDIFNPNSSVITVTPIKTITYFVTGETNGCKSIDSIKLFVNGVLENSLFIPNVFSPNNDDLNDCLEIKANAPITKFEMQIYNRWGNRVFEFRGIDDCWDGSTNAARNDVGIYYYFAKFTSNCGEVFKKGDILLVR